MTHPTINIVLTLDMGLNPTYVGVYLRVDGELTWEDVQPAGAFMEPSECLAEAIQRASQGLVATGWWS